MTKRLRVFVILLGLLAVFGGSVSAYDPLELKRILLTDNGTETEYNTEVKTVEEFLEENDIILGDEDTISPSIETELTSQTLNRITIDRSFPVIVNLDGVPRMVETNRSTVGAVLEELKSTFHTNYVIENAEQSDLLTNNMVINLTSISENHYTTTEKIPFETEIRETDKLDYGIEKIVQEGSEGEITVSMKDVYKGGVKTETVELTRQTTKYPVNTIVEKGTARAVATTAGTMPYQKAMNVTATAYTPYDPGCNGTTATGVPARYGVIAVDPKVIPLGTQVYIPGYGKAIAADTGGAIKGSKIDLCYESLDEAYRWGVRNITIYVLE